MRETTYALALTAGVEQVPFIVAAREMGFAIFAMDSNPDAAGMKYADKQLVMPLDDEASVIDALKYENIAFVLPSPIGAKLSLVGAINEAKGLSGISKDASIRCVDKRETYLALSNASVRVAKQAVANTKREIQAAIHELPLPLIVKPRFGSGSNGVAVIERQEDREAAIIHHLNQRDPSDDTLIEELLAGEEYGVDGWIQDGVFTLVCLRLKTLTPLPHRQEIAYMTASLPDDIIKKIIETVERASHALGLTNCPINADIMVHQREVAIIEIAGRPAGLNMSSVFIPKATGQSFIHDLIHLATGKKIVKPSITMTPCLFSFFHLPVGVLRKAPSEVELSGLPFVEEVACTLVEGQHIQPVTRGKDIYARGYFLLSGDSPDTLHKQSESILDSFEVEAE